MDEKKLSMERTEIAENTAAENTAKFIRGNENTFDVEAMKYIDTHG